MAAPGDSFEMHPMAHWSAASTPTPTVYAASTSAVHLLLPPHSSREPLPPRPAWRRALSRSLRLTALDNALLYLRGCPVTEERKIAVYRDHKRALAQCALHLLPVATAWVLILLNLLGYYIGGELAGPSGEDTEKLAGLQWASKLTELLMHASLGALANSVTRYELVFGDGLPFGAIFCALSIDSISTLWSLEFASLIKHAFTNSRSRLGVVRTALLLLVCILLGVSVGPSSATLMRPRLDNWPGGGTTYWLNQSPAALYPLELHPAASPAFCLNDPGNLLCPSGGYDVIAKDHMSFWQHLEGMDNMPEEVLIASNHSLRQMSFRSRSVFNKSRSLWPNSFSLATVNPAAAADGLTYNSGLWAFAAANSRTQRNFRYRQDVTFTTTTNQPVVMAVCRQATGDASILQFADLGSLLSLSKAAEYPWDPAYSTINLSNVTVTESVARFVQGASQASVMWLDDETLTSATRSSINVVVALPYSILNTPTYFCCSVDGRQAPLTLQSLRSKPKITTGTPDNWELTGTLNSSWPRIAISAGWAAYLSPTISASDKRQSLTSPFEELLFAAGLTSNVSTTASYNVGFIIESAVAALVANGIGRTSYKVTSVGQLLGANASNLWAGGPWVDEFLPHKGIGFGGEAYSISSAEKDYATPSKMLVLVNGYAYSWRGKSQAAAIAVLLAYVLLTVGYIVHTLWAGCSSSAWAGAPELVALALQSETPHGFANTGAGIATFDTFEVPVRIIAKRGRLELVSLAGSREERVQVNRAYA